jgi:hypothetical protein
MTAPHPYTPECDCDFCYCDTVDLVLLRFAEQREKRIEQGKADEIERLAGKLRERA